MSACEARAPFPRIARALASRRFVAGFAALVATASADAQSPRYGVGAGVVVPQDDYARHRGPGPVVRGTIVWGNPRGFVSLRGDLEAATMPARGRRTSRSSDQGAMHAFSALLAYVVGARNPRFAPYVYPAIGVQYLVVDDRRNPYGMTWGARAGAGVRTTVRGVSVHVDVAAHLALTDFGTGGDFVAGRYMPVVIGFTF